MGVYAIGDIQGCYDALMRLLDRIGFDPAQDRLWLAGDLVNRGPRSLEVLRFVRNLGAAAVTVLGNHDLHLLAVAHGNRTKQDKDSTLNPILEAPDAQELVEWLRFRPLIHHCPERDFSMVHAGLPPQWDLAEAIERAREVELKLRGDAITEFCHAMYGNEPAVWSEDLIGMPRLRFITNAFTRLRYCDRKGALVMKEKGPPGSQRAGHFPWFQAPGRKSAGERILFGHWSTLGYHAENNAWSLDTGCVWGKKLTALKVRRHKQRKPIQVNCS